MGGHQPARSLPQNLGEASWALHKSEAIRAWGWSGRPFVGPGEASGQHLNPLFPSRGHTTGNQEALRQVGKPQRREQEPGRFQSTWPGLAFTQLIRKANASWSNSPSPPQKSIHLALLEAEPVGSAGDPPASAGLSLQFHPPMFATEKLLANELGFIWDLPAKDFPLLR